MNTLDENKPVCPSVGSRWHRVYKYGDDAYKVIQWDSLPIRPDLRCPREEWEHSGDKLASSISRSKRRILEIALCNRWDWFATLTLDKEKFDRSDLHAWIVKLTQFFRDYRKHAFSFRYLLIPERHFDGSWHCHGLFSGLDFSDVVSFRSLDSQGYVSSNGHRLPYRLVSGGFYTWPDLWYKFGYVSLGAIRDPIACAFYVTKYMTKDLARCVNTVGAKLYYCSQGLNRSQLTADFIGSHPYIESVLRNDFEFCRTGWAFNTDAFDGWDDVFKSASDVDFLAVPTAPLISFPDVMQVDPATILYFEQMEIDYETSCTL